MNIIEKANMEHFHSKRADKFGDSDVKALGWKNLESQQKRFEVLVEFADLNNCHVLDVGCGHGDLRYYLGEHFFGLTYIGIDLMTEFLDEAKKRYGHMENTYFVQGDFSKMEVANVDYILASGAFGYKTTNELYYWQTISKMVEVAKKGVAFNMLNQDEFPEHPLLRGHNKAEVLHFCKALNYDVELKEGYLEGDFTIFIRK